MERRVRWGIEVELASIAREMSGVIEEFKQLKDSILNLDIRPCCPFCGGAEVVKWGKLNGRQRYKCKSCNNYFYIKLP